MIEPTLPTRPPSGGPTPAARGPPMRRLATLLLLSCAAGCQGPMRCLEDCRPGPCPKPCETACERPGPPNPPPSLRIEAGPIEKPCPPAERPCPSPERSCERSCPPPERPAPPCHAAPPPQVEVQ